MLLFKVALIHVFVFTMKCNPCNVKGVTCGDKLEENQGPDPAIPFSFLTSLV